MWFSVKHKVWTLDKKFWKFILKKAPIFPSFYWKMDANILFIQGRLLFIKTSINILLAGTKFNLIGKYLLGFWIWRFFGLFCYFRGGRSQVIGGKFFQIYHRIKIETPLDLADIWSFSLFRLDTGVGFSRGLLPHSPLSRTWRW